MAKPSAHPASSAPPPVYRSLRAYPFDPSLTQQLETAPISRVTMRVPWEPLEPGPVGEYLEVVDIDPAWKCFYEPVDLNHEHLLAQQGLEPSEGVPQFHQQMVYAVASLTIHHFERALGRKALWAPGPPPEGESPKNDSHYVRRLRIYPHALGEANAYYSPAKIALLFGSYQASDNDPGGHQPGSMVFTCLSHDIIAHETAHALLDGMHRRFHEPTNPDMLAFHEAFADIVALFQHFTFPEILRHQIGKTRGQIRSQETLLGQLASQFGRTTGLRGALRDAIGRFDEQGKWAPHVPNPSEYQTATEPHGRGAILVAAVFDAFLSIYDARTVDLIRLYTGGSGVLPAGAIHPDLVNRLSEAAAKSASHVLTMCVRALDYCPPVDMTFGEYLRAIITADFDVVPDDDRNYRIAFVEAFRRRGIYPRDVRTLSVENLRWQSPATDTRQHSPSLLRIFKTLPQYATKQFNASDRQHIFKAVRSLRKTLHDSIEKHLAGKASKVDARYLGLDPSVGTFEVHAARFSTRVGPDGDLLMQAMVEIVQEKAVPVDPNDPQGPQLRFGGGCTLIIDLTAGRVAYCIRKSMTSTSRLGRQRGFQATQGSLRGTYFKSAGQNEPFALLHRGL